MRKRISRFPSSAIGALLIVAVLGAPAAGGLAGAGGPVEAGGSAGAGGLAGTDSLAVSGGLAGVDGLAASDGLAGVNGLVGTDGSAAADRLAVRPGPYAESAGSSARPGYRPWRGMFLLAAPRLADPRFARTVVLLLEYDGTGALGLVVNRPTRLLLRDALAAPLPGSGGRIVFSGGPVEHRRLIALLRSPDAVEDAQHVFGDVYASGSIDALRRMLERDASAADVHTYLGYAGWSPGQLDAELARGDWIVTPADAASIFDTPPADVWHDLMRRNAGRWVRLGPAGPA